ncbi:hypothetical protein Kpho02_25750 [Kitasatospora phosalacinea]|uniref:DUF397 domain-containing protein n=1 Tax=Kitasatospora phosalacinea TaxID=2065 RepID=A0A9W6V035_9ACTN|nr:DUF397 domain-containing protein [Kitasatospora phosalacinea]GLW70276.1 hypothetical protein Kpho02_25750 [Kitasatospora phosalacinea]
MSGATGLSPSTWRKSSYSDGNGGECVEVDDADPGTVRDSKDPDGPRLAFTTRAWQAFVTSLEAGDLPVA